MKERCTVCHGLGYVGDDYSCRYGAENGPCSECEGTGLAAGAKQEPHKLTPFQRASISEKWRDGGKA